MINQYKLLVQLAAPLKREANRAACTDALMTMGAIGENVPFDVKCMKEL